MRHARGFAVLAYRAHRRYTVFSRFFRAIEREKHPESRAILQQCKAFGSLVSSRIPPFSQHD